MRLLKSWRARLVLVARGRRPGFITANVDNDAGGIFTYSQAGAQFGYSLLWTMIPITIALVVVQEMASRMGAVTGKGLSDLIREEFGFRVTFWLMLALIVTNFGNVVAEFAGVASSLELFGWSKYIVVPVGGGDRLGAGRARHLRQHREDLPRGVGVLRLLHRRRACWRIPTGRRRRWRRSAGRRRVGIRNYGYLFMVIGAGRHDDRAVDAVLPAGVDRREGDHARGSTRVALGRDPRLPVHRRRRLVHHRRVRGDAVRERPSRHRTAAPTRRRRCGRWSGSTRICCSRPGCSTRRCSRRRSCRSPPPTRSAKGWASSRASTRNSTKRRSSTGSTRC